jgi:hypothetical protein
MIQGKQKPRFSERERGFLLSKISKPYSSNGGTFLKKDD